MLIRFYILLSFVVIAALANQSFAFCEFPEQRVQTQFLQCDVSFVGTAISERDIVKKGEEDVIGKVYKFKVEIAFPGANAENRKFIEVYDENDSGSMGLYVGGKFLLFLHGDINDRLSGGCGNAIDSKEPAFEKKINEVYQVIKNYKAGANGDIRGFVGTTEASTKHPLPGVHFIVTGNGKTYDVVSDEKGWFDLSVPTGRYKITSVETNWTIKKSFYCFYNFSDMLIRPGGGADISFLAEEK